MEVREGGAAGVAPALSQPKAARVRHWAVALSNQVFFMTKGVQLSVMLGLPQVGTNSAL